MRVTFLLLSAAAAGVHATSGGLAGCPCLSAYPAGISPADGFDVGGVTRFYSAKYGLNNCAAHDQENDAICKAANPPQWCADSWCYVDQNNCNSLAQASHFFSSATLYFSYGTCGSVNTFSEWFGEPGSGASDTPSTHTIDEVVNVIRTYLTSSAEALENNEPEMRSLAGSCASTGSCSCATCTTDHTWSTSALDFRTTTLTTMNGASSTTAAGKLEGCMSSFLDSTFARVAGLEAEPTKRIGYQYAAFQGQGAYVQWPAIEWCPSASYDTRFRSWYVGAASGPKDIVIVLDVSGSMNQAGRIALARDAAIALIDTLSDVDFVSIVKFSTSASAANVMGSGGTRLIRATHAAREALKAWVTTETTATGTTNFDAALTKALDVMAASSASSAGCTKSILFLTDGTPDAGSWTPDVASRIKTGAEGMHIFTYALGSGADTTVVKEIACDNAGAVWTVGDGGNLRDAMAAYYSFLAPMLSPCQVRWAYYNDTFSGEPLISACVPTFKKESPAAATSCASGTKGCMAELLGVVCLDVSLIVSTETLRARNDNPSFFDIVEKDRTSCSTTTPTAAQLQAIRARIPSQFGNAVCPTSTFGEAQACTASAAPPGATPADMQPTGSSPSPSPSPEPEADGSGSGLPIGLIAGGVVLVIIAFICQRRAGKSVKRDQASVTPSEDTSSPFASGWRPPPEPAAAVAQPAMMMAQPAMMMAQPAMVMAQPAMMAQPMAVQPAVGAQPSGQQMMTVEATVPGGQQMTISHNGQQFSIMVPEPCQPGQTFQFTI